MLLKANKRERDGWISEQKSRSIRSIYNIYVHYPIFYRLLLILGNFLSELI